MPVKKKHKIDKPVTVGDGKGERSGTKGDVTRELLCTAILELVTEHGYGSFRLKDLCERTGLTIGAFYFHFENKDQALEFVAGRAARDLFESIAAGTESRSLVDEFRLVIRNYQSGFSDARLRERTRMMSAMIPANPEVTRIYFEERGKTIDQLVESARRERERAGLKSGPERAVIEYLFSGLADFFTLLYFRNDAALKKSAGSTTTIAERMARLWYDSVMRA